MVAVVGIPLIILITLYGKLPFLIFVLLISTLATYEYYKLATHKNSSPIILIGMFTILIIDLIFYLGEVQHLISLFILAILLTGLVELFRKPKPNGWSAISNLATTPFPIFYIGLSLGTLIGLREAKYYDYFKGGVFIISIFAIIWICDTAAYFVGKSLGKRKLYERVSPNKTVEGFIGGLIFAFLSSFIARYMVLDFLTIYDVVAIAIIVGVFGQLGDLVESLINFECNIFLVFWDKHFNYSKANRHKVSVIFCRENDTWNTSAFKVCF